MFTKYRILLACAASLLTLAACGSNESAQGGAQVKGAVAATVNGSPISESLVAQMLKQRVELGRPASPEARKEFIDGLAMQLVITQEATKKGLDKLPDVADRLELSRQSVLVDAFVQDYMKNNTVSDDTLKAEYEKIKAQMTGTEYRARHILVDKEADAKDVIARLKKNPKAFEALAKEKSKDGGSKGNGGDLGWFDPRGMVPEFSAALAQLSKGKFTEQPVKSRFGYHVILLEDSRPKQIQPLEQIKPELAQHLQQQNLKKLFDELKSKAKIEIAQAPAPAAQTAEPAKSGEPPKAAEAAKGGEPGKK